jgi:hypothetical protein
VIDDGRDFGETLARVTWPGRRAFCDSGETLARVTWPFQRAFRDSGEALALVTWPCLPLLPTPTQLAQFTHFQPSYQDALPARTPTVAQPVQELHTKVARLQAINAQYEAELAAGKALKQARLSEAQARADAATQKARAGREKFVQIVDDFLANSEADVTFDPMLTSVLNLARSARRPSRRRPNFARWNSNASTA